MENAPKVEEVSSGTSALSAGLGEMTHFWCEVCDAIQPAFFEGALHHSTADDFVGGDVVCSVCAFIVATAYTPNDRVEGRDAALSRRVPSHDGLCGNGSEVGAGDTAKG